VELLGERLLDNLCFPGVGPPVPNSTASEPPSPVLALRESSTGETYIEGLSALSVTRSLGFPGFPALLTTFSMRLFSVPAPSPYPPLIPLPPPHASMLFSLLLAPA